MKNTFSAADHNIPTMKPLDMPKKEEKAEAAPAQAAPAAAAPEAPAEPEKIDFSGVVIEPLFADQVDFETFSKSDFRAVMAMQVFPMSSSGS